MNITQEHIDALLDVSVVEEHRFHGGKCMIQSYLLPSGFTVEGRAGLVDITKFDIEIGRAVCRRDASTKLWTLEGYLLQQELKRQQDLLEAGDKFFQNQRPIKPDTFNCSLITGEMVEVDACNLTKFIEENKKSILMLERRYS